MHLLEDKLPRGAALIHAGARQHQHGAGHGVRADEAGEQPLSLLECLRPSRIEQFRRLGMLPPWPHAIELPPSQRDTCARRTEASFTVSLKDIPKVF